MIEWISVKDKRPKRGQMVVWYHPPCSGDGRGRNVLNEYYRADTYDLPSRPASHWMPLEPPCKP